MQNQLLIELIFGRQAGCSHPEISLFVNGKCLKTAPLQTTTDSEIDAHAEKFFNLISKSVDIYNPDFKIADIKFENSLCVRSSNANQKREALPVQKNVRRRFQESLVALAELSIQTKQSSMVISQKPVGELQSA